MILLARTLNPALIGRMAVSVVIGAIIVSCSSTSEAGYQTSPPAQAPTQQSTSTPTPSPNPLVLAPATTPSAVGVCTQQMQFGADGTAGPLLCSDGAINSLAWQYYSPLFPGIFAAGAYATQGQVQQAVAQMVTSNAYTGPIGEGAYCLAKAYYGWQFGLSLDPMNVTVGPGFSCAQDVSNFP